VTDRLLGRCATHGLVVGPDGRCVLCRRTDAERRRRAGPARRFWSVRPGFVIAAAVFAFLLLFGWQVMRDRASRSPEDDEDAASAAARPPSVLPIKTTNSVGRSGGYYLPSGYRDRALPLVVVFHGSGGDGRRFARSLAPIAEERSFIIVAPDSGIAGGGPNWSVADRPGELTDDFRHVERCLVEAFGRPFVRVDPARMVALGYSGGGSSAAYLATADARFSAFAVLHGGVFAGGLGPNPARGFFSTGESGPARPVSTVRQAATAAQGLGLRVTFKSYPGGHEISEAELRDAIDFLLGPAR
jgi:phospholipase/carboxylesterase